MDKKRGRPTEHPKTATIKFRIDVDTQKKIDFCANSLGLGRSETLRYSIRSLYDLISNIQVDEQNRSDS